MAKASIVEEVQVKVAILVAGSALGEVARMRGVWKETDHRLFRSFSGNGGGGNGEKWKKVPSEK